MKNIKKPITGVLVHYIDEVIGHFLQEASGFNVLDPSSVYRLKHKEGTSMSDWDQNHMYLQGASHLSFLGRTFLSFFFLFFTFYL